MLSSLGAVLAASSRSYAAAPDGQAGGTESLPAYLIVGGVALGIIIGFATIRSSLSSATSKWSLSDALSEEIETTLLDAQGQPVPGKDGQPQSITRLCASTSRFIAMLGLIVILMMYVGFGLVILSGFARDRFLPDSESFSKIQTFLLSGLVMFAPYLINKFSSVFDWLKPAK